MKRGKRTDYPTKRLAPDTYVLNDFGFANCYLLLGDEAALLIDCGMGIGDIEGAVRKITDKPLIVVGTHGHVDHIGGSGAFEKIYLHRDDCGKNFRSQTSTFIRKAFLIAGKSFVSDGITLRDVVKFGRRPEVVEILSGHVFDLGGRKVRVEHSPGHTLGSIVLLDDKTKIAFVGDNMSVSEWLFLPHATTVEKWLESARRIRKIADDYALYWGHERGLISTDIVDADIRFAEEILSRYKRNRLLPIIKCYPKNDRVKGSIVFKENRIFEKKKQKNAR